MPLFKISHSCRHLTFSLVMLAAASTVLTAAQLDTSSVPGTVISHQPASTGIYLGSPGIAVLDDGSYLAKCDEFGPNSTEKSVAVTRIYRSTDRGQSWSHVTQVLGMYWASIFTHGDAVYLLGNYQQNGDIVLMRSADGGDTWTKPVDAQTGLLFPGNYHCAPMPVIEHNGRLWRPMEDTDGPNGWGSHFRSRMLSVPINANLLHAENWTLSNPVEQDSEWLDGNFGGWLEGNAVVSPSGDILNILRVHSRPLGGIAAVIDVSKDGTRQSFNPETGFIDFPGGAKKFAIRKDPQSDYYWSLANWIPPREKNDQPSRTRNTVALIRSQDLRHWEVRCALIYHPDRGHHGYQYPDWLFDGDDMIAAIRTAHDDGLGGAHNQHDANFLTFHRFENFRELKASDSVPELREAVPAWNSRR